MNSKSIKISDPQRLLINLSDKTNLKSSDKYVALSNLTSGILNFNYMMDDILYQIFIFLSPEKRQQLIDELRLTK